MATGPQRAATPNDGPMGGKQRKILTKCRRVLVRDMDPIQVLRLFEDPHMFSEDEQERIMAKSLTRQQQCERLLDILPRKGAEAYKNFKETIGKVHPPLVSTIIQAGK